MSERVRNRLAAQRALLGAVTPGLRAVSIESDGEVFCWRCIFESDEALRNEQDQLSAAATEVCADLSWNCRMNEEYVVVKLDDEMQHLADIVYLRFEEKAR